MGDTNVPATSKAEVPPVPGTAKPEVNQDSDDVESLKSRLDAAEKARAAAERKLEAAARKGKSAEELQAALEKREEEFAETAKAHDAAVKQRDKLFQAVLKPRLDALPEHARELVKRAGKESPEALLEALELAEKAGGTAKHPVQGGPVPSATQATDGDFNRRWDKVLKGKS